MRLRPLFVLVALALCAVLWLSTRTWLGHLPSVWRVSCVLGMWAPLGAAAVLLYVRAVGDRENNVFAAWTVRALGMHCVLLWLVGANDLLRGPPGYPTGWNADLGGPILLFGFAPVFALCLGSLSWALSVDRRLRERDGDFSGSRVVARPTGPYRSGVALVAERVSARPSFAPFAITMTGAVLAAVHAPASLALGAAAVGFAAWARSFSRPVVPSLLGLAAVAGVHLDSAGAGLLSAPANAVAWPLMTFVAGVAYLALCELRLRVTEG